MSTDQTDPHSADDWWVLHFSHSREDMRILLKQWEKQMFAWLSHVERMLFIFRYKWSSRRNKFLKWVVALIKRWSGQMFTLMLCGSRLFASVRRHFLIDSLRTWQTRGSWKKGEMDLFILRFSFQWGSLFEKRLREWERSLIQMFHNFDLGLFCPWWKKWCTLSYESLSQRLVWLVFLFADFVFVLEWCDGALSVTPWSRSCRWRKFSSIWRDHSK